jgi:hypothetical protein
MLMIEKPKRESNLRTIRYYVRYMRTILPVVTHMTIRMMSISFSFVLSITSTSCFTYKTAICKSSPQFHRLLTNNQGIKRASGGGQNFLSTSPLSKAHEAICTRQPMDSNDSSAFTKLYEKIPNFLFLLKNFIVDPWGYLQCTI